MKSWIRWHGLFVFMLLFAVFACGYYFFAGAIVKAAIEYSGSELVGAKVELNRVDVTLSPLGLELHDLQVTSPDDPMVNAVQVGVIKLNLDGMLLLRRKVIVNETTVDKVRFNTKRIRSGKLIEVEEKADTDEPQAVGFTMPAVELPDIDDILARETLETERLADQAQQQLDKTKQQWDSKTAELPNKETFDAYGAKLKSIKPVKTGNTLKDIKALTKAIDELSQTREGINGDLNKLVSAQKELRVDLGRMKNAVKAVSNAPSQDIARLKDKYSPSSSGVANISNLLFGETAANWTKTALDWYARLGPVLLQAMKSDESTDQTMPRHKGQDIRFEEDAPLPDFLIKTSRVSLELESGTLNGEVKNVTSDQMVLGKPMSYVFESNDMKKLDSLNLSGKFDHTNAANPVDTARLVITGYQLSDFSVSGSRDFPLTLDSALMAVNFSGKLEKGKLNADLLSDMAQTRFVMDEKGTTGKLSRSIGDALESVKKFNIKAGLDGTVKDHKIKISSDLDDVVKAALGEQFREKTRQFEHELRDKVGQKTQAVRSRLESKMNSLSAIEGEFDSRQKNAREKLQSARSKLDALKKEKQAKLKKSQDKLKSKSKDKLDKLKEKFR